VSEQAERYVGFLAHELRNPLGTARLALSLLREKGEVRESPAVRSLDRALDKMHDLLDGALTDFTTRRAPRPQRSQLEIGGFLREVVAEAAAEAESKGVSTSVEVSEPIHLRADPRLLGSAVSNLVRNAIKFSPPGTEVQVEAKRAGSNSVLIAVTDGCGGLPPGSVERLFSPFVQAGTDRSGFGLGLAIARQAAEAHGGAIRVHDLPGRGCVFVLDLPDQAVG
jgi:signal transduction histidine kinase